MGLTIREIDTARPTVKQYKLADGKGLCLLIVPSGAKLWRYRFEGKEKMHLWATSIYLRARGRPRVAWRVDCPLLPWTRRPPCHDQNNPDYPYRVFLVCRYPALLD
jgi:hypothetical protein